MERRRGAGLGWASADAIAQDVRFAARSLARAPWLAAVVAASFAIVIGANTATFGVIDALCFAKLQVPHPEQLASVLRYGKRVMIRYGGLEELRRAPGTPRIAGYRFEGAVAEIDGDPENTWLDLVSGDFFELVGAEPLLGRTLTLDDERAAAPVVVLSEPYWRRRFNGDPRILGRQFKLNALTVTIVGVMPRSYTGIHFARQFNVAAPITISPAGFPDVRRLATSLVARLDPGTSRVAQATATLAALQLCCTENVGSGGDAAPPTDEHIMSVRVPDPPVGENGRMFSGSPAVGAPITFGDASSGLIWSDDYRDRYARLILIVAVGCILLLGIACANIATLLLARSESREREFAVRAALGASGARITALLLIESLVLAIAGGSLGLMVAWWALTLARVKLAWLAVSTGGSVSWAAAEHMLVVTLGAVLLCTGFVGAWPARIARRSSLVGSLAGSRSGRGTPERTLIAMQSGLSVVLACGAALFLVTVRNLVGMQGGYGDAHILTGRLEIRDAACTGSSFIAELSRCMNASSLYPARRASFDAALRAINSLPGVAGAALAANAPVLLDGMMMRNLRVAGGGMEFHGVRTTSVSSAFFTETGIAMLAGRDFSAGDTQGAEPVAVISASLARRWFGSRSPIGDRIEASRGGGRSTLLRIVGVARDMNFDRVSGSQMNLRTAEREMVYEPLAQNAYLPTTLSVVVRTRGNPRDLAQPIQRALLGITGIHAEPFVSLRDAMDAATVRERLSAFVFSAFGLIALTLMLLGVYAALQHDVTRRTRELGIRMALGARGSDVQRLVVRQSLSVSAIGIAAGVPLTVVSAWVARAQFYGISPLDPRVPALVATLLTGIALLASYLPARRAAKVDPVEALRYE